MAMPQSTCASLERLTEQKPIGKKCINLPWVDEEISGWNKGLQRELFNYKRKIAGETMRSQRSEKGVLHRGENDIRDWYLIGFIAVVSSLVVWLPLLGTGR
jgi:hypothetical protein